MINDSIRVLHIFPPSLKTRFGGQNITWKYNFSNWDDPRVTHLVLDTMNNKICTPQEVFNFEYPKKQKLTTRWERAFWVIKLGKAVFSHQNQYDLLHFHILWWGGLLTAVWLKVQKKPTLYESILLDADTPNGILQQRLGKLKLKCLKTFKGILAISDFLADEYLKNGFSEKQVFRLMNSVDTELFKPCDSIDQKTIIRKRYGLPNHSKIMLFVGSVIERKGVDTLIRAFIKSYREDHELYLLIVGAKNIRENPSIDEEFINNLHILLKQEGIEERVYFIGLIQDRTQLAEIYRAADLFLFPSRNEGLGNVILEAMASGLPVVASKLPVFEKIIRHSENGLNVEIEDEDALKDAILKLNDSPKLVRDLGKNARNYVMANHTFHAWQSKLIDYYKRIME